MPLNGGQLRLNRRVWQRCCRGSIPPSSSFYNPKSNLHMSEHRLGEIVIECPRNGRRISAKKLTGYKKNLEKITQEATEDGLLRPYLIKIRKRTKCLSDHLGPIRRFLRSKTGQPWDSVYSELCQRLDTSTIAGQHVLHHVFCYVEQHVEIIDEIAYRKPCRDLRWDRLDTRYGEQFYIHPETGILCLAQRMPKRKDKQQQDDVVILDQYHQYRKINDIWYLVEFADIHPWTVGIDVIAKAAIAPEIAIKTYGKPIYAVRKHQCSKREIKFIHSKLDKDS
jgi:hypothetical protein